MEDPLLGKVKVIQHRRQFLVPLQELCLWFIRDNMEYHVIRRGITLLQRTTPECKNLILTDLIQKLHPVRASPPKIGMFQDIFISMLYTPLLKSFNFSVCGQYKYPSHSRWLKLVENCPALTSVSDERTEEWEAPGVSFTPYLGYLMKFGNMQNLVIQTFSFATDDLCAIADGLGQLQTLRVVLFKVASSGIKALAKLEHFREFEYVVLEFSEAKIATWCLQFLPKLKIIGGGLDSPPGYRCAEHHIGPQLQEGLGLEHYVHKSVTVQPNRLAYYLPHVKYIRLGYTPTLSPEIIKTFPKLTALEFAFYDYTSDQKYIAPILNAVGSQLTNLIMTQTHSSYLDIGHVMHACPNLISIKVTLLMFYKEVEFIPSQLKLKKLHLVEVAVPDSVMLELMNAPQLEEIIFRNHILPSVEGCLNIAKAAASGQILQSLKWFDMEVYQAPDEMKPAEFPTLAKSVEEMMKNIAAHSPVLEKLCLSTSKLDAEYNVAFCNVFKKSAENLDEFLFVINQPVYTSTVIDDPPNGGSDESEEESDGIEEEEEPDDIEEEELEDIEEVEEPGDIEEEELEDMEEVEESD